MTNMLCGCHMMIADGSALIVVREPVSLGLAAVVAAAILYLPVRYAVRLGRRPALRAR